MDKTDFDTDSTVFVTDRVLDLINEELSYQTDILSDASDDGNQTLEGKLAVMKVYLDKAFQAWVDNAGDREALNMLRKVVAVGVRAMVHQEDEIPTRAEEMNERKKAENNLILDWEDKLTRFLDNRDLDRRDTVSS